MFFDKLVSLRYNASKGLRRGNTWGNTPFHTLNPDALKAMTTIRPAVRVIGAVQRTLISAIVAMTWKPTGNTLRAALLAALAAVQTGAGEEPVSAVMSRT